ncbi:MAG: glycosyltransferase family 4 protein [Cyanobacteria bacterium J06621_12]
MNDWICCQIGAREHYTIPRLLHANQQLKLLVTDAWLPDRSILNLLPKKILSKFRQRYHAELKTAPVKSFNYQTIDWEITHKTQRIKEWDQITARNSWWQKQVIAKLSKAKLPDNKITLFAYSYAALEIFQYAKTRGWNLILGQIDPGIIEEKLIFKLAQKYPHLQPHKPNIATAPLEYWSNWREECNLADRIIVNSHWSRQGLQQIGISDRKIKTIPLAYEPTATAIKFQRTYPDRFTTQRPLKVLFLGQVIIRKGVAEILEAIKLLSNLPIEFWFVGQIKISLSKADKKHPQIKWLGSVSRNKTNEYYQQADVFLFPTHSDGFGLTQLEAQSWQLPIIASQFCGAVVKDRINGLILPQITAQEIVKSITFCLENPQKIAEYSHNSSKNLSNFSFDKLTEEIINISNI